MVVNSFYVNSSLNQSLQALFQIATAEQWEKTSYWFVDNTETYTIDAQKHNMLMLTYQSVPPAPGRR